MRPALAYLFDRCEKNELQSAVRSGEALSQLRIGLTAALTQTDRLAVPAGERGDNLILGLIALRLKFPRSEAEQKLERNLALRAESR
jgi:hypothetical protein